MSEQSEIIEGVLDRVIFQNADNHWTVARITPEAGGPEVTIVGNLAELLPGVPLHVRGKWVEDKRFGRQFRVESWLPKKPETLLGIERYLGSSSIPGVGRSLAKRIVDHFKNSTMEIIENNPDRLCEVDGIGTSRAQRIAEAWRDLAEINEVMIFLQGHNASPAHAARIFKRYGNRSIEVVRENPYRLALDVWGIGFRTADVIASSLGIAKDAPERLEAAVLHVLGELSGYGHCHAPEQFLIEKCRELLDVDEDLLAQAIQRLLPEELIAREYLTNNEPCVSLGSMKEVEENAAILLAQLAQGHIDEVADVGDFIARYESGYDLQLATQQRRAIEAAARSKISVITGGPGVGKTTIVRAVVAFMHSEHKRIALAAPTGRAAKRLAESTEQTAVTLHRLLGFQPRNDQFEHHVDNPLDIDVAIVDEASMIDLHLFYALLCALPDHAQLVLVGDVDQLPSVGAGSVLSDVINSDAAKVVRLSEIFRQAAESKIVMSAHAINAGEMPLLEAPTGDSLSDFYFIERGDPRAARETIVELVAERIPARFGFDALEGIQVLTPMHRGELGTISLNQSIQDRLGDENAPSIARGRMTFRAGDKVMQIRNNYEKEVFNGDVGIVRTLSSDDEALIEFFDGRQVTYSRNDLDELIHAFACSIHKSQGSEYPAVVIALATQHYMMLQRNLIYTAITRGKSLVVIVGSKRALHTAIHNTEQSERWTWLDRRIQEQMGFAEL